MLTKFLICQKHVRSAYNDRTQCLSLMLDSIHFSTDSLIDILSNVKASYMSVSVLHALLFNIISALVFVVYPGMWASPLHNHIVHTEGVI